MTWSEMSDLALQQSDHSCFMFVYSTCKLEIVLQIKNVKSCVRSMSDDDLVRNERPGLTAVAPFMLHVCNIFSLHIQFLICMYYF